MRNFSITSGVVAEPVKVLIYGSEGIGKSTLASKFPGALFIDTEGSTKRMDVARLPTPESWDDILDEIRYVAANPEVCSTLVIDTMDWAEGICCKDMLAKNGWSSIADPSYGKGYDYLTESFRKIFPELNKVVAAGIHVVLTAHAALRKFEQPDEMGAYDRWEMKLQKKNASLVKEWVDTVLFCNYKTIVVKTESGSRKAQGGERVIYTTHRPTWDAKNRFGFPDVMPMTYESIAGVVGEIPKLTDYERIPKQLRDLMERDSIDEFDIQNLVGTKQWAGCDSMTPIFKYPRELIDFLVGDWEKVKTVVSNKKQEIPFLDNGGDEKQDE